MPVILPGQILSLTVENTGKMQKLTNHLNKPEETVGLLLTI